VGKDGRRFGRPPDRHAPPARPEGRINTTDPDARRMKFGRNFIPAYNAQAAVTEQQIIVAAEIATEGGDFEQLDPVVTATGRELQRAGVEERPEVVLADAGHWSNDHIDALRARGMIPIVAPDTTRSRPRKTRLGGPYDYMRRVLATERGDELYSRRLGMVEPVFGQIKANRRIGRFKRRGRAAARSEWRLIAATHNLLKLHRHTLAAATGLVGDKRVPADLGIRPIHRRQPSPPIFARHPRVDAEVRPPDGSGPHCATRKRSRDPAAGYPRTSLFRPPPRRPRFCERAMSFSAGGSLPGGFPCPFA
jgi:Transposase DDE domain